MAKDKIYDNEDIYSERAANTRAPILYQDEDRISGRPNIVDGENALAGIYDHSQMATMNAKIENSKVFAQMYNITEEAAYEMHDLIVKRQYPGDKASPESVFGMMREVKKEAQKIEELNYVAGLIGNGDDDEELWGEFQRLKAETENGLKINRLNQTKDEREWNILKRTMVDAAGQFPQLTGRAKELLKANPGDSFGYFLKNEDDSKAMSAIKTAVAAAAGPATASMRYTHITQAGQIYREIWDELDGLGIEMDEEMTAVLRRGVRSTASSVTAVTEAENMIDFVLTSSGAVGAMKAVASAFKAPIITALKGVGKIALNSGVEGVSEYIEGMHASVGTEQVRNLLGLRESGTITDEEYEMFKEQALSEATLAARVSLLTAGAFTAGGAIVGGVKAKSFQVASFTKTAKAAIEEKKTEHRAFKAAAVAGVFNDINVDDMPELKKIKEIMANKGSLNSNDVRRAYKEFVTHASNAKKGESLDSIYAQYRALLHADIKRHGIERPVGVYASEKEAVEYYDGPEYSGRLDLKYSATENGGEISISFNGNPQIINAKYAVSQSVGAGIIIEPITDLGLGDQHPLHLKIKRTLEDFRQTKLQEGTEHDIDSLNLPDSTKEILKKAKNSSKYFFNMVVADLEPKGQHKLITDDLITLSAELDGFERYHNTPMPGATQEEILMRPIEWHKGKAAREEEMSELVAKREKYVEEEKTAQAQGEENIADFKIRVIDQQIKELNELIAELDEMYPADVFYSKPEMIDHSSVIAALKQGIYKLYSDEVMEKASSVAFNIMSNRILKPLRRAVLPEASRQRMTNILLNYGVWEPTFTELRAYETLPEDRLKWTREQEEISRKVEARGLHTLTLEEVANLTDKIRGIEYAAERILDVTHMGVVLNPKQAVDMGVEEIRKYNNIKDEVGSQTLNKTKRSIINRKLKKVKGLAYSFDNLVASIAGDVGVVYDTLAVQIRESNAEAERQMYRIVEMYNTALLGLMQEYDASYTEKNLNGRVAKWARQKMEFLGVELSNDEILSLYIHDRVESNYTHIRDGIMKDNAKGAKEKISREIVEQAVAYANSESYFAIVYEAMKAPMEELRISQELALQVLTGDDKYRFGYKDSYFPIEIYERAYEQEQYKPTDSFGRDRISTNKSNLLERTSSPHTMIVLKPALATFQTTVERASRFVNQEKAFWRASRIMQDPEFKETLINASSLETWEAIWKGLEDTAGMNSMWNDDRQISSVIRTLMAGRSVAALGFNPVSAARAWASSFGIMAYVDADVAMDAITMGKNENGVSLRRFVSELSALYSARVKNGMFPEFMRGRLDSDISYKSHKFKDAAFWMMKNRDADAAARAWMGGYLQVMKDIDSGKISDFTRRATMINANGLKNLTAEQKQLLGIQAGDYLMNLSQPSSEVFTKSGLQRAGIAGAMLTQFGSSVNAMRQQAIYGYEITKRTDLTNEQKAKKIAMIATGLALQASVYVGVGLLGAAAYGQLNDSEDKAEKKLIADFTNTFMSTFGIGRVLSLRVTETSKKDQREGADSHKLTLGVNVLPVPVLDASDGRRLTNSLSKIMQSWDGKEYDDGEILGEYIQMMSILATSVAPFTPIGGIPSGQIKKGLEAFENWTDNDD